MYSEWSCACCIAFGESEKKRGGGSLFFLFVSSATRPDVLAILGGGGRERVRAGEGRERRERAGHALSRSCDAVGGGRGRGGESGGKRTGSRKPTNSALLYLNSLTRSRAAPRPETGEARPAGDPQGRDLARGLRLPDSSVFGPRLTKTILSPCYNESRRARDQENRTGAPLASQVLTRYRGLPEGGDQGERG